MSEKQLVESINRMSSDAFVTLLGGIFEHSPWVAAATWKRRPFDSIADLHRTMCEVVKAAKHDQQLALLRAHPQLAGTAAQKGELTAASTSEQNGAGLTRLSDDEMQRIARLNQAYAAQFGFPFIIAVRNHDKQGIFAEFERRIENSMAQEIDTALEQVGLIAAFRLQDLTHHHTG